VPEVLTTPALLGPLVTDRYRHPQPSYVLLQNGLGVESDLYWVLKERQTDPIVISCALYIMTNITADGNVSHGSFVCLLSSPLVLATHLPQDTISVGIYQDNTSIADTPAQTQSLQRLVDIVTRSGSDALISPNIAAVKFHKNLW
jgi:2-dehydropantoate 2-reductase